MQIRILLAAALLALFPAALTAETPSAGDVPQPVPAAVSLAGAPRPDVSRFLNVRTADEPSLSPDGSRLAFTSRITGVPQLWVVDSGGGWPRQLTFGEAVTFHRWSPAGVWIVYGTDRGGDEREGYYLITPDGEHERELLAPADAFRVFGGFSRDGGRIAYATSERNGVDFDVRLLDVASGEDREVYRGRGGLYPVSWRPDGGALILSQARGEDANDVYLLDLESGRLETLFAPAEASRYAGFGWKSDGSGFFLATDQERDLSGLAYYEIAKGHLSYLDAPQHDVEQVALAGDGSVLAWTTNEGGFSVLHARDLKRSKPLPAPELPAGTYDLSWAPGAPVAAVRVASPKIPGDVWIWNAESGSVDRATHSSAAGLDLEAMVTPEHLSFTARDGVELHGLLYLPPPPGDGPPAGPAAGKPPLLLAVHGGPTGQARPRFDPVQQYLLTRGIAVFDLNFRGSTGYGKRFARLNDRRLREGELYDLADAALWLQRDGRLDARRAAVMGASYGGYLAMAAMSRLPGVFASGVARVGVSDWLSALEGASPQLKASDVLEYGDVGDAADREFFRRISPVTHAAAVRSPMMVLHGANDPRVPVSQSDRFVAAIREPGGEVDYLRFSDEGHGIRKLSNRIIAYRRIAAFLERTLQPPADD